MNKKIIGGILAVVVIAGGAYYAGTKVSASKSGTSNRQFLAANGQFARGGATRNAGGFAAGEILSKDANGFTLKMQDGSTKIVLMGTSTQVMKTSLGSVSDLLTGTNITVTGSTNSDGSVTAQSIQIRPAGSAFPGQVGQRGQNQTQAQ